MRKKTKTEKEKRLEIIQKLQSKFQWGDASFQLDDNCLTNKIPSQQHCIT